MAKTWKELEAEGVARCCVYFNNGKRCRARAVKQPRGSWCAKHAPMMEKIIKKNIEIIKNA